MLGTQLLDIKNFFRKKGLGLYFTENPYFEVGHISLRHCDVLRLMLLLIFKSMERRDPISYRPTMKPNNHSVWSDNFDFTWGCNRPILSLPPLLSPFFVMFIRCSKGL